MIDETQILASSWLAVVDGIGIYSRLISILQFLPSFRFFYVPFLLRNPTKRPEGQLYCGFPQFIFKRLNTHREKPLRYTQRQTTSFILMRQKGGTEDVEEVCHFFKSNFRDYPSRAPEELSIL